ncbi:MAG: 30S ribosomal protein S5 [Clostridiales bacterium]|jgi:small subunit ribosomal protein S5|nr:30S ribosomal protein S5 [Clostridiales bacterium]
MARREREELKPDDGFSSKLVSINRVTKVVKGGRNMRFTALVVVGDGKGSVGIGTGKAAEVPEAIRKAEQNGRRNLVKVAMADTTIPHKTNGAFGKSNVLLRPAPEGTGVIAGSSVRAVVELAGIKNITTKAYGSRNPVNCVKAAMAGLAGLRTPEQVAALRGKAVEEL